MTTPHGFVLGKFMPPHRGHVHLCEVAARMCEQLTIVVASLPSEEIPGEQRVAWMRELFPRATIVHHTAVLPQEPSQHPAFWDLWRSSLRRIVPQRIDRVFTSDAYGERLAKELGATWVPIDPGRTTFPISATQIRTDPMASFAALPRVVRPYYVRRISVFGPESTGKSTLAGMLADELGTVCATEFARGYLEAKRAPIAPEDLPRIAEGQIATEDAAALEAHRVLVCDSDPLLTAVWDETLYGDAASKPLRAAARARRYELTLLCDVDLPWVADSVRYLPNDREGFYARCEAALRMAGRTYVVIRGQGGERMAAAREAVAAVIARRPG